MARKYKDTPTYNSWNAMRQRCLNPHRNMLYVKRGIKVCDRWSLFVNFLEDMGERPPGTTLDRIDNNGNYEPGNCRWASVDVQANNKTNNRFIEFQGRRQTISQWANEFKVSPKKLAKRLKNRAVEDVMFQSMFGPGVSTPPRMISHGGKTQSLKAWARDIGIASKSLRERLNMWPVEKALTEPPRRILANSRIEQEPRQ